MVPITSRSQFTVSTLSFHPSTPAHSLSYPKSPTASETSNPLQLNDQATTLASLNLPSMVFSKRGIFQAWHVYGKGGQ